jgi:hypothetical protein
MLDRHEVTGSIPVHPTKLKASLVESVALFLFSGATFQQIIPSFYQDEQIQNLPGRNGIDGWIAGGIRYSGM